MKLHARRVLSIGVSTASGTAGEADTAVRRSAGAGLRVANASRGRGERNGPRATPPRGDRSCGGAASRARTNVSADARCTARGAGLPPTMRRACGGVVLRARCARWTDRWYSRGFGSHGYIVNGRVRHRRFRTKTCAVEQAQRQTQTLTCVENRARHHVGQARRRYRQWLRPMQGWNGRR